jgi:transcriptional regulator with XRE-family HTH domain
MRKSEYQNFIINKIRRLREERQYSQEKIATLLGLSNGHIGNIESTRKEHKYTLKHIFKICQEFNYPIEQIFLEEEDYLTSVDIVSNIIMKIIMYEEQGQDY